tara:strand:- start:51 stop:461 length:411 start_codon:yes stop_codon:yes gene_type:complete
MNDANFPNGLIVKPKHQNAPDFVVCDLSFKTDEFIQWLQENDQNGWVNAQLLTSRAGKLYAKLNDWQPQQQGQMPQPPQAQGFQNPQAVNSFQQGNNQAFQSPVNQPPQFQESPQQAFQNEAPMQANPQYQQPQQN